MRRMSIEGMRLNVYVKREHEGYLKASARLRKTTAVKLVRKIVATVLESQLILATLDDEDEIVKPARPSRTRTRVHLSA